MKISSLAELRELLKLLAEQDIGSFELDGLKIVRNSRNTGLVQLQLDDKEYSEPNSEASESDDELLFYSAGGN